MGIGFADLMVLLSILLLLGYGIGLPLAGMWCARRRMREHRHSRIAVVWPSVNLVIFVYALGKGCLRSSQLSASS